MALEQRLRTDSQQTSVPIARLRKLVVFDRLMARLLVAAPDRWLLKGALALDYRLGTRFRMTRDLDLGRQDDVDAATIDMQKAATIDLDDYFVFVIDKSANIAGLEEGAAVRFHLTAELAGRRFESVNVDVAFGNPVFAAPETLQSPGLLAFAEIDPITVRAIPIEQHIAEKVHAYTRRYADQQPSSRVKDLIDLVLIQERLSVGSGWLAGALRITFEARNSHAQPSSLPEPPDDWATTYRLIAGEVALSESMVDGHRAASTFLDPILADTVSNDLNWDPQERRWL